MAQINYINWRLQKVASVSRSAMCVDRDAARAAKVMGPCGELNRGLVLDLWGLHSGEESRGCPDARGCRRVGRARQSEAALAETIGEIGGCGRVHWRKVVGIERRYPGDNSYA